jgi:hypothetical protein
LTAWRGGDAGAAPGAGSVVNGGGRSGRLGRIGITTTGPLDGGGMNGVVSPRSPPPARALPTEPAPGPIAARIGSDEVTARANTISA